MLQARPLYDNRADAAYFVVPPIWDKLVKAADRELNTVLIGARGSGKTTLLRQVQKTLRDRDQQVSFVDANAVTDPLELSQRIRDAVRGQGSAASLPDSNPIAGASRLLASNLQAIAEAGPTTVLVDASGSAESVYGIFGRMRDVLWQQHHTWVVAISHDDRATALRPPADAFFDVVAGLPDWSTNELTALLAKRLGDERVATPVLASVVANAGGNPRAAIRAMADAVLDDRDPADSISDRAKLLDAAAGLGRPHGMLMAELLDRGQASPSDSEVQATLGLTRARLTHLLRELLDHGLVVADVARSDGPGRPRTVYRPDLER